MRDDDQELRELFQHLFKDQMPPRDGHPAIEALAAYRAGELTPEDGEHLIEHFVVCPECVALYLDQDSFFDPGDGVGGAAEVADIRSGSDWPALRARLSGDTPEPKVPRKLWGRRGFPLPFAA